MSLWGKKISLGRASSLRTQIEHDDLCSLIFWGHRGCGKTTLARIIANRTRSEFVPFSAVLSGIKEIKEVMSHAEKMRHYARRTIVFVDEVHRFNRAQQDAFLPHVEAGNILLIGATTENPSFEVIAPLLSRMKVYVLHGLATEQIVALLRKAIEDPVRGLSKDMISASEDILERIAILANGDVRSAYNTLEALVLGTEPEPDGRRILSMERLEDVLQKKLLPYDKSGEEHFNIISALHKSVRNSDPDATLYWLARHALNRARIHSTSRDGWCGMASEDIGLRGAERNGGNTCGQAGVRIPGCARRASGAGASGCILGSRAEVQCALRGIWRGAERFERNHRGACSAASKKRGHRADGKFGLRKRLSVCA